MIDVLSVFTGIFAGLAAFFWLSSALTKFPTNIPLRWDGDMSEILKPLKTQSRLSGYAAACAGVAAISQLLTTVISSVC